MQRQLTITDLRGIFIKDYDTFGKMDPFLQFIVGKQSHKTETAHKSGKEPKWNSIIVIKFFSQQNTIVVKGWQQDTTLNDYMGQGIIDIKSLKQSGDFQVKIIQDDKTQSGTIYGKYLIKNLAPIPLLTIKNIRCDFFKDKEFLIKTKPFFAVGINGNLETTTNKQKGDCRKIQWYENLRLKLKEGEKITFSVQDKNDKENIIFVYDAFPKQFKTASGSKKFNVIDKNFQPLGVLEFDFETQNFVSKEDSVKNQEAANKQRSQLTQVNVDSIKGNLNKQANDLYFKIIVGSNFFKTPVLPKAKKDFDMSINKALYAQKTENKIVFAAYNQENIGGDSFYGSGELLLENLAQGKNIVRLTDRRGKQFGQIFVNLTSKNVISRQLSLTDIKVKVAVSADFIGDSDIFVVGAIGGWTSRTQAISGKQCIFKKNLNFKFSDEKEIVFHIMDEDISKDDIMYEVKASLQDFKETGQLSLPLIPQKYKNDKSKHGQLIFRYKTKNIVQYKPPVPASIPIKIDEPKKQQIKTQQPKKIQQKKQVSKKQIYIKQPIINQKKLQQSIIKQNNLGKLKSIDKSRSRIKFPSLNDPKNFGDKIYDKQSSSTLQKSILVYSLPKANRFNNAPKYTGQPTFSMDSCFKTNSGKGVGFGFGNKKPFPEWLTRNMKQNPAPGTYFDLPRTSQQQRSKGPTFGIPYKYYEKVTIPKQISSLTRSQLKIQEKPIDKKY